MQKRLRWGTFKSVRQHWQAIFGSAERHNDRAHGYLRKALPEVTFIKVFQARAVVEDSRDDSENPARSPRRAR